jgi:hypothetical protein
MTSGTSTNSGGGLRNSSGGRILTIDWSLLFCRLRMRVSQLFHSARYRLAQTEYTPPAWAKNFKLNWFRLGLIGLTIFVFTQKQIDFTVSVGKAGVSATNSTAVANSSTPAKATSGQSASSVAQMSVLPTVNAETVSNSATTAWSVEQYDVATVRAYINRFERVAETEAEKFGIPTAAKLAIGILESDAGRSPKTVENNNHFGTATANGFYANAWANWRSHSEFMNTMYPELLHNKTNAKQWVAALGETDYSRDSQYTEKLLALMSYFNL